ncbi:MAG: efflux RND transporter periplasmic adaptor subunit [Phycisphaerales bacterium]|nr:MAG: efflux RND transporter periplasmic adaptor subunit [Phycisphaerales bacterium]
MKWGWSRFLAALIWTGFLPVTGWAQEAPTKVTVALAEQRQVVPTVTLVGTVEPSRRSIIGAEVVGLVSEMPVRQGDAVEHNQLLCALKDDTLRFELAEAEARHENLRSRLEELEAGTREEEKRQAQAELEEAQAELRRWDYERERVDGLHEEGKATLKEYRDTHAYYDEARQRVAQAQARYDLALAGPRSEVIAQARHLVAAQSAVVERIRTDLAKTRIKAPFAGQVVQLFTEVGQWIERGGEVVELIELQQVLVRVDVPEFVIPYCRTGAEVPVTFDALKKRFTGRIKHIVSQADPAARTFPVEVEIDNPEHELRAGMFARATLVSGSKAPSVVIPKDAVVHRQGVDYVALVRPGQQGLMAFPMPVTLGTEDQDYVAVTSGNVPPGAQLIVRGNENILFPMPVIVSNPTAPADAGPKAMNPDVQQTGKSSSN